MSTVDRVERAVMARLLRGDLAPGSWLRQDEFAASLGVSKIPVREAMQRLAASGLVRFEQNRGAVIPELTADDADENYTLRRALEPELLRRAVPAMSIVDLAEAEMALTSAPDDPSGLMANWRFHRALYSASGWSRGVAMVEILHASVAPYVLLYTEGLGAGPTSDDQHALILEACRRRDADHAISVLLAHLDGAADAVIGFLSEDGRDE